MEQMLTFGPAKVNPAIGPRRLKNCEFLAGIKE